MNAFNNLGRLIFPITFIVFGLFHFMNANVMADYVVPAYMPAKVILVYLTGAGLVLGGLSMYLGKYDKLGATLLALFMLLVVLMVHLPGAMGGGEGAQTSMSMLLKDLGLMGGCMMYAHYVAKDRSIIG
ncbi:MAG: DoxX family protein [Lewinellaceae bacterium]|nr:DoxX family protein [Lewinellaceae bacterium]